MKLNSIQYSQYDGLPREWRLEDCTFCDVNLMVGQNATGKSRTLQVVSTLAGLLSGELKLTPDCGSFDVVFYENGHEIQYLLKWEKRGVVQEQFSQNGQTLLRRGADGTGKILAQKLKLEIDFQPPVDHLAVVSRRDAIQHPFLEKLYNWGKRCLFFHFGTPMGQDQLALLASGGQKEDFNLKDENQVVAIFHEGVAKYGSDYYQLLYDDMGKLNYHLEKIGIQHFGSNGRTLSGIRLKEKELAAYTSHHHISTGMFRTLSLLTQLNYSLLNERPSCVMIDDIGEGLDYIRSMALIDLLIEKAKASNMQLIMSTNDRFVMNRVPLHYWSVIRRFPHKTKFVNYRNSKELFDEFEFTGLSNFDFFSSNYLGR
jgi:hypothetical protein